jgi:DNA-binding transcriptional ArsR family regulator
MDMSSPYSVVLSPAEGPILALLAGTTKALSGREVARLSGVSANGAWKALRRLAEHGLVREEPAGGNTTLYTLNREHVAVEAITTLARLRSVLVDRLKNGVAGWTLPPVHASLYGSAARGDGDTRSDIDLFVVRPTGIEEDDPQWRSQLDELAGAALSWTGNHAGIAEVSESELMHLRRERPPVIEDVVRDGIMLAGEPAGVLLGRL